jgi:hypothetical protein
LYEKVEIEAIWNGRSIDENAGSREKRGGKQDREGKFAEDSPALLFITPNPSIFQSE